MNPVIRRIATHALLTGLLLTGIGILMGQAASAWLASPAPTTARGLTVDTTASDAAFTADLRTRVPLYLALWGVGLVLVGETALHFWRKQRPAAPAAVAPQVDEAERLLEELLAQAEARATPDVGVQTPAPRVGELVLDATEEAEPAGHPDAAR